MEKVFEFLSRIYSYCSFRYNYKKRFKFIKKGCKCLFYSRSAIFQPLDFSALLQVFASR